jgi:hypothetical protein
MKDNQDSKVIKSQLQMSFSKKGLKVVRIEVERLADNSEITQKQPDHFDFQNSDHEHVVMVKKSLLAQTAEFLGLSREEANSAFPISRSV